MGSIVSIVLTAVLQAVVNYFIARQHDADLKEMGYNQSQRDVAVANSASLDAATAARTRSALVRLSNPGGLRAPDKYSRRST